MNPHQRSISKGEDATKLNLDYNKKAYSKDKFINYNIAVKTKLSIKETSIGKVGICPFEYNPVKNQLFIMI